MFRLFSFYIFFLPLFFAGSVLNAADKPRSNEESIQVIPWIKKHFESGKKPPFSFVYQGRSSKEFIHKWKFSSEKPQETNDGAHVYKFSWKDKKSNLQVQCEVKAYPAYQAVEWVLHFKNLGTQHSPNISQVKAIDYAFEFNQASAIKLHYADGTHVSKADFHPRQKDFNPGESLIISPESGRSSDNAFPFFNVEANTGQGVIAAIGWTGTWQADFKRTQPNSMELLAGMKSLDTYLEAGEEIRSPSICLLFWEGTDRMVGHNTFRRFMVQEQTHKIKGKPTHYPISNSFNYGDPFPCNEYTCLTTDYAIAMINRYKQFNLLPEVFWLDAGWYAKSAEVADQKNWANTVGNWEIDSLRFPDGLKPISDAAHKVGAKFMVWFEPERVIKESKWGEELPEWMLDAQGTDAYLYDLGNPEALKWLCQYIGDFMEQNGIDYYRQDFNMRIDNYWEENDKPGRRGIREIRHIEGLYAFWDYILTRFPEAIVDNCASGGRRIDFETMKRSAPLWRTDYHYGEPVGYQSHTFGLNFFLPQTGTGVEKNDRFTFRSSLGTSVVYNWKITDASSSILEMQKCQKEFADVRPYFYEDYYPLTPIEDMTSDKIWMAYQLHRPSDQSGFIVGFRRQEAQEKEIQVKLAGLMPDKTYQLVNYDTQEAHTLTGKELAKGLTLLLENPRSSLLWKYSLVDKPAN